MKQSVCVSYETQHIRPTFRVGCLLINRHTQHALAQCILTRALSKNYLRESWSGVAKGALSNEWTPSPSIDPPTDELSLSVSASSSWMLAPICTPRSVKSRRGICSRPPSPVAPSQHRFSEDVDPLRRKSRGRSIRCRRSQIRGGF
jgi:hypothetical protein